jgi:amidase
VGRTNILAAVSTLALAGCTTAEQRPSGPSPATAAATAQPVGAAEAQVLAAMARIERLNSQIRAVIAIDPTAVEQARGVDRRRVTGPLAGRPVLIKDNIETAGPLPTTAGSLALANNVTGRDAPLVARLRAAGAVILGKTNLSEWANIRDNDSISGWSAVGGQNRNPYALDRNTCGSSSGSAAAVAAGFTRLAIGTETDGSIICPAAMNGIVGLKPTLGLVSRTHVIPISASQDTPGPMAATVRDAAELLTAIAGSDPADAATREADRRKSDYVTALQPGALRGKRLGVMRFSSGFGTNAAFETALAVLREQGADLVEIKDFKPRVGMGSAEFQVLLSEFKAGLNDYLRSSPAPIPVRTLAEVIAFNQANAALEMRLFGQDIFEAAEKTKGLADPEYRNARATSLSIAEESLDGLLRKHRVAALIAPSRPAAWKIDAVHGDVSPGGGSAGSFAAVSGYPHLTVPMGMIGGLPVGLSFIGPKWSEALLLSLGHAFEQARGPMPAPQFLRSVEEGPLLAPALEPQPPPVRR